MRPQRPSAGRWRWRRRTVEARADEIVAANAMDMEFGREKGLSAAMLDRLMLDEGRIAGIATGLRAVATQDDPVGQVIAEWDMESGLHNRAPCACRWA